MDFTMASIELMVNVLLDKQKNTIIEETQKLLKEQEKSFTAITTANIKIITGRFDKLKSDILNNSAKIATITNALETSNQKILLLETELNKIKKFIHVNDEIVALKFEIVKEKTKKVSSQVKDKSTVNKINKKLREIEDRSRRNNLRINGIKESEHETWVESELKVLKLFEETLEIKEVKIERAHRTGPRGENKNRTIVLKLLNYKDKTDIMKRSVKLKGMNFYINEDFCFETVQIRKDLKNKMFKQRELGKHAFISYDKLIVREYGLKRKLTQKIAKNNIEEALNIFNIICVTETWCSSDEAKSNSNLHLPGFYFVPLARKTKKRGGGVLFYVSEKMRFINRPDVSISDADKEPMDIHYDHDYALPVVPVSVSLEKDLKILQNTPKRILKKPLLLKHRKRLLSKFSLIPQAEFTWNRLSHSDRLIKFYTGCTKKVFMFLVSKGKKKYENVCYYKGKPSQSFKFRSENKKKPGNKRTLTIEDEILLMCMKLRLDLAIQDLAFRFSISNSQCSSILTTWITYFGNELKPLLLWPTGKLHNVEGIIDCTEQKIQKPSNAKAQYQTFSTYKSCNTLKKLVVTTKTGSFSFISKAYGGQASDRHITEDCNVINMFSEGSVCLADKGFNIQDLLLKKKVVLVCPPFKKKGLHFTRTKVLSAKEIARSRVHVERSIRRLKEFNICKNELSLTMLDLINYIYIICGALSNLQPSIVKGVI
nr:uncharacterized protein LOC124812653 [Hydra vulgaris]